MTPRQLKKILRYDPASGVFTRLECQERPDLVGVVATGDNGNGYSRIVVGGFRYYCHRLAWFYVTGKWPKGIDHIDGNRANNAWSNLREATPLMNKQNQRRPYVNSRSGILGVSWDAKRSKWTARIKVSGLYKFLGRFDDATKARDAYLRAKRKYHEGCTI